MTGSIETVNVGEPDVEIAPAGRLTGVSMIAAPILLTVGAALLIGIYEGSPAERLAAFADNEARATAALNVAIAGVVLAVFAVAGVAAAISSGIPASAAPVAPSRRWDCSGLPSSSASTTSESSWPTSPIAQQRRRRSRTAKRRPTSSTSPDRHS